MLGNMLIEKAVMRAGKGVVYNNTNPMDKNY